MGEPWPIGQGSLRFFGQRSDKNPARTNSSGRTVNIPVVAPRHVPTTPYTVPPELDSKTRLQIPHTTASVEQTLPINGMHIVKTDKIPRIIEQIPMLDECCACV